FMSVSLRSIGGDLGNTPAPGSADEEPRRHFVLALMHRPATQDLGAHAVGKTADGTGIGRRLVPSWPLIVGLAVFIRALAQPTALLNDPDTYLHISAGRWMLAHAALPVHDPFSHSLAGAVWVPHEWLAELVLATVYDAVGWSGLVLLTAAAYALSLALLTRFLLRCVAPFS